MRPVNRGATPNVSFKQHGQAKPELIRRMGEFCCYCERRVEAINLDVEHIKPKEKHKKIKLHWSNFLLSCKSCNSNKNVYQGNNRHPGILKKSIWPHIDNTSIAFEYDPHGRVRISATLTNAQHVLMAKELMNIVGLDHTPATAAPYRKLALIYDVISRRERAWNKAQIALATYQQNPTNIQRSSIKEQAEDTGFFSIWMKIFEAYPAVRQDLIAVFKADASSFDPITTLPVTPRPGGRI